MFNLWVDYPSEEEERTITETTTSAYEADLHRVLDASEIMELQQLVRRVPAPSHVVRYAVSLARATRPSVKESPEFIKDWVSWGAGPRASQYLILGAKTRAIMGGRYAPSIEDVIRVAPAVLRHRIVTNFSAEAEGVEAVDIVRRLIETVPRDEK